MIAVRNLRKHFPGDVTAVDGISFDVSAGEALALLGASGCGKTTTLKMLNGLVQPSSGQISIDGRSAYQPDPIAWRRKIGYVFQGVGLFPHWTVQKNLSAVPQLLGWNRERVDQRLDQLFEWIGLDRRAFAGRYPHELSGGQQQRIGVARALAAEPAILLMDEPFGALDPIIRDELQRVMVNLRRELNQAIVIVTHDVTEALTLADKIAIMDQGRIVQMGTPAELLSCPANAMVAEIMGTPERQAQRVQALFSKWTSKGKRAER